MGMLVEGCWTDADDAVIKGRFLRPDSANGSPLADICDRLQSYARDLFAWRGVAATVDLPIIRAGYYRHDLGINPFGIVPVADEADWTTPHDRARFGPAKVALVSGGESEIDPATLRQHTARRTR